MSEVAGFVVVQKPSETAAPVEDMQVTERVRVCDPPEQVDQADHAPSAHE